MGWVGGCLILIASTLVGFQLANRYADRVKQLQQFQTGIQILGAEIHYGQVPLQQAAARVAKQIPNPVASFFQSLSERLLIGKGGAATIFADTLTTFQMGSAFCSAEIEVIRQFGETLGRHDQQTQAKQIEVALLQLSRIEKEARTAEEKYARLFKSLGFLGGLMVVILLI